MHALASVTEQTGIPIQTTLPVEESTRAGRVKKMAAEWKAIMDATGFEPSFSIWLADPSRFGFRFVHLPTAMGIKTVIDILSQHVDRLATDIKKQRAKLFRMNINIDVTRGNGAFTFKLLKPAKSPPLEALQWSTELTLQRLRRDQKGKLRYKLVDDCVLDTTFPIKILGHDFRFSQHGSYLTLQLLGDMSEDLREALRGITAANKGPTSVFVNVLKRLNWQWKDRWILNVGLGIDLNFLEVDKKTLTFFVNCAWERTVLDNCNHRVNLTGLGSFDLTATRQLVFQLPSQHQLLVIYHIVGAISTNIIRSKYDMNHEDQTCTYCDARDTVEHRLFTCPITQQAREDHPDHSGFAAFDRAMIHCPLMPRHADEAFHRCVCFMRDLELSVEDNDEPLLIYADASMDDCKLGVTCSAFAVITLESAARQMRHLWAQQYRERGLLPPFHIAYSAKTPGLQTINRGEFGALIKAITLSRQTEIVTDSCYAMDLVHTILDTPEMSAFVGDHNLDLIMELIKVLQQGPRQVQIRKVASHQPIDITMSDQDLLDRLGNDYADAIANLQRQHDTLGFVQLHASIREHRHLWTDRLQRFYAYIVQVGMAYQAAWKKVRVDKPPVGIEDQLQRLQVGVVAPFLDFTGIQLTPAMRTMAYFTTQYTEALLQWAKMLQWPVQPAEGPGVTYIELLLSFLRTTGMTIPVNMAAEYAQTRNYMLRHQTPEAAMQPRSRSQDLRVFSFSLEYLNKLTGQDFFPVTKKAMVKSLGFLGVPKARSGFRVRCRYPHEPQILQHIAESVKLDKTFWTINNISNCEGQPDITEACDDLKSMAYMMGLKFFTNLAAMAPRAFMNKATGETWSKHSFLITNVPSTTGPMMLGLHGELTGPLIVNLLLLRSFLFTDTLP
eukprot:Skav236450  [mRNA]  locus=scaffold1758:72013:83637:+ [translate_table: standard]